MKKEESARRHYPGHSIYTIILCQKKRTLWYSHGELHCMYGTDLLKCNNLVTIITKARVKDPKTKKPVMLGHC
jgi:hypothetical protein